MSLASVLCSVFFAWRVDILIRIANFNVNFDDARELKVLVAERLGVAADMVSLVKVVRKAVDARRFHGAPIRFV